MAEAIQNSPRNLKVYLTNRIRDLDRMIAASAQADKTIKADDAKDGEYLLRYALRNGPENTPDYDYDAGSEAYLLMDARLDGYNITSLKDALESYLKYGPDFLKYIFSSLEHARPVDDRVRKVIKLLPYAEAGLENYGYRPGHPEDEADPEYQAAKKLIAACRVKADLITKIEALEDDVKTKLSVIKDMRNNFYADEYRPKHEEIETLYHATAFMKEILQNGFLAEPPPDRIGVGNYGHQRLISFSHDLEISRNIMRSFKEIWMIAHHQLTAPQILSWARAEGIEDDIKKTWKSQWNAGIPMSRDADPGEVGKLYRLWQWLTKTRANPVLTSPENIVAMMKNRSLDDIGVLACKVRLEPTDKYLHAEAEFRLPADRVISVKQIL